MHSARSWAALSVASVIILCSFGVASAAPVEPSPGPAQPSGTPPGIVVPAMMEAPPSEAQMTYARFTEGATAQPGLFTIWRKQGQIYLELSPAQLDHPYLLAPILSSGL